MQELIDRVRNSDILMPKGRTRPYVIEWLRSPGVGLDPPDFDDPDDGLYRLVQRRSGGLTYTLMPDKDIPRILGVISDRIERGFTGFDKKRDLVGFSGSNSFFNNCLKMEGQDLVRYAAIGGITCRIMLATTPENARTLRIIEDLKQEPPKCSLTVAVEPGMQEIFKAFKTFPFLKGRVELLGPYTHGDMSLSGTQEATAALGLVDAIADITQTGDTLDQNGLEEVANILNIVTCMGWPLGRDSYESFKLWNQDKNRVSRERYREIFKWAGLVDADPFKEAKVEEKTT